MHSRVLVVEDEAMMRESVGALLAAWGYAAEGAATGDAALEVLPNVAALLSEPGDLHATISSQTALSSSETAVLAETILAEGDHLAVAHDPRALRALVEIAGGRRAETALFEFARKERVRNSREDAGAVAGLAVGGNRAAMREARQRGNRVAHERMRRSSR